MEEKTQSANPDPMDIVPLPIANKTEETEEEESTLHPKKEEMNEYEVDRLPPPPLPIATEKSSPNNVIDTKKAIESPLMRANNFQSRSPKQSYTVASHLRSIPPLTPMSSIASDGSIISRSTHVKDDAFMMATPPVAQIKNNYVHRGYEGNERRDNARNMRNDTPGNAMGEPIGRRLRFYCNACGRSFTGKQHFEYHMRTHSGEKPFKCAQCGKAFRAKHSLKNHLRIHTGERPYPCKFCGKYFRQLGVMKNHIKNMHSHKK